MIGGNRNDRHGKGPSHSPRSKSVKVLYDEMTIRKLTRQEPADIIAA